MQINSTHAEDFMYQSRRQNHPILASFLNQKMQKYLIGNQRCKTLFHGFLDKRFNLIHSNTNTEANPKALDVQTVVKHHNQIPKNQEQSQNCSLTSRPSQGDLRIQTRC